MFENYFMERKGSEKQLSPCLQVCGELLLQRTNQPTPREQALPMRIWKPQQWQPGLDSVELSEGEIGGCGHQPGD